MRTTLAKTRPQAGVVNCERGRSFGGGQQKSSARSSEGRSVMSRCGKVPIFRKAALALKAPTPRATLAREPHCPASVPTMSASKREAGASRKIVTLLLVGAGNRGTVRWHSPSRGDHFPLTTPWLQIYTNYALEHPHLCKASSSCYNAMSLSPNALLRAGCGRCGAAEVCSRQHRPQVCSCATLEAEVLICSHPCLPYTGTL